MANRERVHKDFVPELVSISDFYNSAATRTGNHFRETLDQWLGWIVDSPEAFAPIHNTVRAVRIRTFPYVILHEILADCVFFISIVHGASDRENWFHRSR
jgi:hypothetical protein